MEGHIVVSIIIPVYNMEKYLRRCLDSVAGQTYPYLQIVVVDDGSTDSSGSICDEYAKKDSRFVVIHRENGGLSAARNSGLELPCSGKFIMFVDSDDWIDKNTIEVCVQATILEPKVECVLFPYIREFGNAKRKQNFFGDNSQIFDEESVHKKIFRRLVGPLGNERFQADSLNDLNTAWGKMIDIECVGDLRFSSAKIIGTAEDVWFNIQLFAKVKKAVYIPTIYYHYNKENDNSIVHTYNPNLYYTRKNFYKLVQEFIEDRNLGKDFIEALWGRKSLEVMNLCRNIMNADLTIVDRYNLMKSLLGSSDVVKWLKHLNLGELSVLWRIYYGACKFKLIILVMFLTFSAERLKRYLRGR